MKVVSKTKFKKEFEFSDNGKMEKVKTKKKLIIPSYGKKRNKLAKKSSL